MLKPQDPLTLKVISLRRGEDLSFAPEVYGSCGSFAQLIGGTRRGGGEGGAVATPGLWLSVGALSAGRDFTAARSSSGVLPIC